MNNVIMQIATSLKLCKTQFTSCEKWTRINSQQTKTVCTWNGLRGISMHTLKNDTFSHRWQMTTRTIYGTDAKHDSQHSATQWT